MENVASEWVWILSNLNLDLSPYSWKETKSNLPKVIHKIVWFFLFLKTSEQAILSLKRLQKVWQEALWPLLCWKRLPWLRHIIPPPVSFGDVREPASNRKAGPRPAPPFPVGPAFVAKREASSGGQRQAPVAAAASYIVFQSVRARRRPRQSQDVQDAEQQFWGWSLLLVSVGGREPAVARRFRHLEGSYFEGKASFRGREGIWGTPGGGLRERTWGRVKEGRGGLGCVWGKGEEDLGA